MTYDELLKTINQFEVSELKPEQLNGLKAALQIKISCINFYQRLALKGKNLNSNSQEKCEE